MDTAKNAATKKPCAAPVDADDRCVRCYNGRCLRARRSPEPAAEPQPLTAEEIAPLNMSEQGAWKYSLSDPCAFPDMDPAMKLLARRLIATIDALTVELAKARDWESAIHRIAGDLIAELERQQQEWAEAILDGIPHERCCNCGHQRSKVANP